MRSALRVPRLTVSLLLAVAMLAATTTSAVSAGSAGSAGSDGPEDAGTSSWEPRNGARPAPVGSDPFRPGEAYSGDFPDPSVMRVGSRFYAASTTIAGLNLPMSSSTDLRTWTSRPASDPERPQANDAMPRAASWAKKNRTSSGRAFGATWAPTVVRLGEGRFIAAYSVPRARDGRRCVSIARASSPLGPYVDARSAPLTCLGGGAIDPMVFRDRGKLWLLYKVEGRPDKILVRRLTGDAARFGPRSRNTKLLVPATQWEGEVVENPAMIRYNRRLYLFYSGNGYGSPKYATGHAVCRSVTGPCTRVGRLLASGPYLAGPGGAHPFFDLAGRLRLVYHAWRTGNVGYPSQDACLGSSQGCPQRRLYVAILGRGEGDRLVVRRRY